jgi:hypothetical protein
VSAGAGVLLDDRRYPTVRQVVGKLLTHATTADFAIARVRLAAVDLSEREIGSVRRCRVLLGRLDVEALSTPEESRRVEPERAGNLLTLRAFLTSGRAEIRTAGATMWVPDFSILTGLPELEGVSSGAVCLLGAHYFARPYPTRGPALTCLLSGRGSVATARDRFEELWDLGYDVLPVITETLDALLAGVPPAAPV